MGNILLVVSIIFYLYVMRKKKIPIVSLYGLFGLQWFYYWVFTFIAVNNLMPSLPVASWYVSFISKQVISYFLMFNALFMFIFSFIFLLFYKAKEIKEGVKDDSLSDKNRKYRSILFYILLITSLILIVLGRLFPYNLGGGAGWVAASASANLRNIFVGLFVFYMLIENRRKRIYLLCFLFIVVTVLCGSRIYLAILTASFVFYLYDMKVISLAKIVALLLIAIFCFSLMGVLRTSGYTIESVSFYLWWPLIMESVFSSFPGFTVTNLWLNNEIKYYNYFSSYIVDPIMIFVPRMVFELSGVAKSGFNTLGQWEDAHGGRGKISPYGAYYYLGEAMEAAGLYGIIIVSLVFATVCLYMEKLRYKTIFAKYVYYSFVGTFGFGFVKNQFAWCSRMFLQNVFSLICFLIIYAFLVKLVNPIIRKVRS